MKSISYEQTKVVLSFWERTTHPVEGEKCEFKKRYYNDENKMKEFVKKLMNSGRDVFAVEYKIIYKVEAVC